MYDHDPINHPRHYNAHPSGVECIQITRHMNFNLGNAVKYIWRAGQKSPNLIEDLQKAIWYLNDEIGRIKNDHRAHQSTNQVQSLGEAGALSPREGIPSTGSSEDFRLVPRREKSIREPETQDGPDQGLGEPQRDHSTDGEAESDYERNTVNLAYRLSIMADKALLLAYNYWHDVEINRTRLGSSANCIAKKSLFLCQQEFKKRNMQIPIL